MAKKKTTKSSPTTKAKARATKKKASPKKKRPEDVEPPFPRRLRGNLLLKFRAAMAEHERAKAQHENAKIRLQLESIDQKYRKLLALQREEAAAKMEIDSTRKHLRQVQQQVAAKLEIPEGEVDDFVIDTETGAVNYDPVA